MTMRKNEPELRTLMHSALDGNAAAYADLLELLGGYLRGYFRGKLLRMGRSAADAEDILQETLMALHTRRHTFDRSQLFTPWVQAIARYKLIDYLRRTRASARDVEIKEAEDVWAIDSEGATDSTFDLEDLLANVSPKMRQTIRLVKLEGLSVNETAARMGMSASAVKVSVHRGLKVISRLIRLKGES
jgi:RNA polymerase sigma-70 factor (ECF subfamily)